MVSIKHRGFLDSKIRGRTLTAFGCFAASRGFFFLGYDQGVMSGIITEPMFPQQFPQMEPKNKSDAIQALVVAIYEIGCSDREGPCVIKFLRQVRDIDNGAILGASGIICFGDKIGRRRYIIIRACIMLIGATIQTSSFGLAQLTVGRIVTGVGNGMITSTIPVWQSEMAPPKIRGFQVLRRWSCRR
ncbi:hypothetical protein BDV96DRAFT_533562 [Lophiotrema nucula]|uniref:Major facilitator superfamily (MFS) profile domain-containing protein n=1 Tax=Lophiotrema nucula TaxID=690887 RepID=A0A6A5YGZ2_9PLEO|nr:hypothetical protein BDV96DRAFT_533562 [Lophiotrema nucula]